MPIAAIKGMGIHKIKKFALFLAIAFLATAYQNCAPDSFLPPSENNGSQDRPALEISNAPSSITTSTESLELRGRCIDVFGSHQIDYTLNPGDIRGSVRNPCVGDDLQLDIPLTSVGLQQGAATLVLTLFTGFGSSTKTLAFSITGSSSGGCQTIYMGQAPTSIVQRAAQAAAEINAENPGLVLQSCPQDRGFGNHEFLFKVLQRLRQSPTDGFRWGLNGKRGNASDMSTDVVDYYWGNSSDPANKLETYVIDVIISCGGPDSRPGGIDVTLPNVCGRWVLAPFYPY